MGKYMKKGKITGDVAVMEIPQNSTSLGVRTRARTLALQPNPELSYLQLRSRRLEKPPFPPSNPKTPNHNTNHSSENPKNNNKNNNNNSNNSDSQKSRVRVTNSGSAAGSKKSQGREQEQGRFGNFAEVAESEDFHDLSAVEPSFGENNLDFDSRERSTRESTPCSLIRDSENITTPGSSSRPTCSAAANRRARNPQRAIPTNPEMEEFFAGFEHDQQKLFIEKYNYDIMNDMPLPGRYEWVRVDH